MFERVSNVPLVFPSNAGKYRKWKEHIRTFFTQLLSLVMVYHATNKFSSFIEVQLNQQSITGSTIFNFFRDILKVFSVFVITFEVPQEMQIKQL